MRILFTSILAVVVAVGCDGRRGFSLRHELKPQSMEELSALSEVDLERVDVGRMNLICARETGCGAAFEVADLVRELDVWAEKARQYEMRYRKTFERNPSRYDNSYAKYKAVNLALMVKLSNAEALSVFLETAGYCLEANGRVAEAIRCYKQGVKYRPRCVNLRRLSARRVNRRH